MLKLQEYKSIVFDCDGVILNSNKIKTRAFRIASFPFGYEASTSLEDYHLRNGGISRYAKFDYFLTTIVPINSKKNKELYLKNMLKIYSEETEKGLLDSEITFGLHSLRNKTRNSSWSIVSGGDQDQLHSVFAKKEIIHLFNGGIFGSPDTKNEILNRELARGNIKLPALFLGDTELDHKVSVSHGLDFIFVSAWTEFRSYEQYCIDNSIRMISKVYELID
ncbi:HAD family hydrolase [Prochlorococcus marinus]|uniref:HAD family hydrolase n=1 Tax=Prochlorococcus marinus TaxID=1219 RepID=UPI0022B4EE7A|nr:HAD hydrolase-like protein [Prochlorococcus marinus]